MTPRTSGRRITTSKAFGRQLPLDSVPEQPRPRHLYACRRLIGIRAVTIGSVLSKGQKCSTMYWAYRYLVASRRVVFPMSVNSRATQETRCRKRPSVFIPRGCGRRNRRRPRARRHTPSPDVSVATWALLTDVRISGRSSKFGMSNEACIPNAPLETAISWGSSPSARG